MAARYSAVMRMALHASAALLGLAFAASPANSQTFRFS